jgi:hypothetical protein
VTLKTIAQGRALHSIVVGSKKQKAKATKEITANWLVQHLSAVSPAREGKVARRLSK